MRKIPVGTRAWWILSAATLGAGTCLLISVLNPASWWSAVVRTEWAQNPTVWIGACAVITALAGPWAIRAVRGLGDPETILGLFALLLAASAGLVLLSDGGIGPAASLGAISGLLWGGRRAWAQHKWDRRPQAADEPLNSAEDDCFSRERLVRVVSAALTSDLRCPRVAVVGPIGTGKTTLANFVRNALAADGHVVARFDPWHHTSEEDSTSALLETIESTLREHSSPSSLWAGGRRALRATFRAVAEGSFAAGLTRPVEASLAVSQRDLETALRRALPRGKRLVLIVDDLERCGESRIREILMRTHELFDAEGLAYLFTYDSEAVRTKLSDDFDRLISKTMDVTLRMPDATVPQLEQLDRAWFETLSTDARDPRDAFASLASLLPTVARERKLFHARLSSWPSKITSAPASLDMRTLCALLLFEHYESGALQRLANDTDLQSDLAMGAMLDAMQRASRHSSSGDFKNTAAQTWANKSAQVLHQALRDDGALRNLKPHLDWLWYGATPITEEYGRLRARLAEPDPSLDTLFPSIRDTTERRKAWLLLGQLRASILEEAADAVLQTEVARLVRDAANVSEVRAADLERVLPLSPAAFGETASLFFYWMRFGGVYVAAHDPEWRIVSDAAGASSVHAFEYMAALERPLPDTETPEAWHELRRLVQLQCARHMVEAIRRGEAAALFYSAPARSIVDGLLRNPSSPLYDKSIREDLSAAFAGAVDRGDAGTLLSFLDTLVSQGGDRYVDREEVIVSLWRELTIRPLNRRLVGSLHEIREKVPEPIRDELLAQPAWWDSVLAESAQRWRPPHSMQTPDPGETEAPGEGGGGDGTPAAGLDDD